MRPDRARAIQHGARGGAGRRSYRAAGGDDARQRGAEAEGNAFIGHIGSRALRGARMTVRLSRRDTLLRTAAVAAAGAHPRRVRSRLAAPLRASSRNGEIDAVLQARVDAADVPGVVAMAATEHSVIYQGAFGVRSMGAPARMSIDTVFSIASMTKLLTSVAAHATRRTRQAQTGRTGGTNRSDARIAASSRWFRCARNPATARRAKARSRYAIC